MSALPAEAPAEAVVLAADASRARLFAADTGGDMRELVDLDNWAARLHEGDLVADRGGQRGHGTTQGGYSAYGGGSMKAHRAEEFAAEVCERAARGLRETRAQRLYVIAEPRFLGLLRQRMDDRIRARVAGEIDKELTAQTPAQIRAALPAQL
jgi:protein required for attachment to host cells